MVASGTGRESGPGGVLVGDAVAAESRSSGLWLIAYLVYRSTPKKYVRGLLATLHLIAVIGL